MHAEALISMTDTVGLLRDPKDPTSLIRRVDLKGVEELKAEGIISGGMIPKVECCTNAIRAVCARCSSSTAAFPTHC